VRNETIAVLIADDREALRRSVAAFLASQPDIVIVAEAADGLEAILRASPLKPDVVVTDMEMPGANGLKVARQMCHVSPGTRVVVLTMHEDRNLAQEAFLAGAAGFVTKRMLESQPIPAVRAAVRGGGYVQPDPVPCQERV
jgi:DNA-binding NarL/FixJ family response regulator